MGSHCDLYLFRCPPDLAPFAPMKEFFPRPFLFIPSPRDTRLPLPLFPPPLFFPLAVFTSHPPNSQFFHYFDHEMFPPFQVPAVTWPWLTGPKFDGRCLPFSLFPTFPPLSQGKTMFCSTLLCYRSPPIFLLWR